MGRRGYPSETRQQALAQLARGRSAIQIAHTLGVSVQSVYRWRAEAGRADVSVQEAVAEHPEVSS